jgi:type VI secretion system secreted protein Hcp
MSTNITIKIGTIEGDSAVNDKEIEVLSWGWGLTQSGSAHNATGGTSGSADVRDLTITKYVDKASPNLISDCFYGTNEVSAVMKVMKSTGDPKNPYLMFVTMTMGDTKSKENGCVIISSVTTGQEGGNDRFIETVTLNFNKVIFSYNPQKMAGGGYGSNDKPLDIAGRR